MGKAENEELGAMSELDNDLLRAAMWGAINAVSAQGTLADWIRGTASMGDESPAPEEIAEIVAAMSERLDTHLSRIKNFVFDRVGVA